MLKRLIRPARPWLAAVLMAALAACGDVAERAAEKEVELEIEDELARDGVRARVDIDGAATTVTAQVPGEGGARLQIGAAVSEVELGLPYYPGATVEGGASKVVTEQGTAYTVRLLSADPAEQVATFYRGTLQARAEGKQFADLSPGDGTAMLMLGDRHSADSAQIQVAPEGSGTRVQIVVTRGKS